MSEPPFQVAASTPKGLSVVTIKVDPIPRTLAVKTGPAGVTGPGVPAGGLAGYVLTKASDADYDTAWEADIDLPAPVVASDDGFFVYYGNYPDPPPGPGMLGVNFLSQIPDDPTYGQWFDPFGNQLVDFFAFYSGDTEVAGEPVTAIAISPGSNPSIYYAENATTEEDPGSGWVQYNSIQFSEDTIGFAGSVQAVGPRWDDANDPNTPFLGIPSNPPSIGGGAYYYSDGYGRPKWMNGTWDGSQAVTPNMFNPFSMDRTQADGTVKTITSGTTIQAVTKAYQTDAFSGQTGTGTGSQRDVCPNGATWLLRTRFECVWSNALSIYLGDGSGTWYTENLLATIAGNFAAHGTQCFGWMEVELTYLDQSDDMYTGLSGVLSGVGANTIPLIGRIPVSQLYAYGAGYPICIGIGAAGNDAVQTFTTYGSRLTRRG